MNNIIDNYTHKRINVFKEFVYILLFTLCIAAGIYLRSLQVDSTFYNLTTILLSMSVLSYLLCFFLRNLNLNNDDVTHHKVLAESVIFTLETLTLFCLLSLAVILVLCGPLLFTNVGIVLAFPIGWGSVIQNASLITAPLILLLLGVSIHLILLIINQLRAHKTHRITTNNHVIKHNMEHIRSYILNFGYFYRYSAYE